MKPTPILRGASAVGSNKRHVKHETAHSSKSESTTDSMSRLQNNQLVAINSDNILNESLDQARFNLATHVMSNGVQLIIASDKIKHIDKQAPSVHSSSISLSSRNVQQKPVTLAPSTLKNHMILAVPTVRQENFSIPIEENQFITKTCLTTYTYHTTYLNKGSTTVESREKIVLNRQTEERKFLRASSKLSLGVTLSNIPELVVGIFPTTYHYYNSIKNNDFVIRSSYTIINTVTGPEDYISFLQPSEDATPLLDTNTYYSPLNVIITHLDGVDATRFLADENILTQVVITESIPPRGASKSKNCETLTAANQMEEEIQIYATKTYLTTVTYHLSTDLGLKSEGQSSIPEHEMEAQTNLQTKVIVNVMTDVVPNSLLRPELVSVFQTELIQTKGQNNRKVLVTLATLLSGETLQITAVNIQKNSSTATPTVLLRDQELVKHSFDSLNPTSVIVNTDKDETTKVQVQQNLDQSLSESEKNSVYIKPVMKQPSQSSSMSASPTVDQLIGSLNLKRFRPVFDVMAEFLQKQLVNRQAETKQNMDDLSVMEKNQTNRLSTQNQLDEKPVYIPLQTPEPHTDFQTNSIKPISHINLKRLTAYSLHINPPDFPDGATDSWLRQQNNNSSPTYIESVRPHSAYGNSVLNNGISIRPGEIINANADVIIGRPNGIGIQYFRQNALSKTHSDNDILIEYTNQTSTNYNVSPLKKKNWIPPAIPLSLTPPRIIPIDVGNKYYNLERLKTNRNQHRGLADGFNHILRPPASQAVHKYTEFSTASSSSGAKFKLPGIDNRPSNNRNSHLYGSQQLIGNLNAELHDNKILEIKQIPQIFATQLPTITTYLMSDSNYYQHISPKISAHHHVSLKTDVLNHNVNINVPPLTFKRESENFPLGTALRGHIATPPIPLIKIPLNKAHVEVEITPQNTRLSINAANTANDSSIIKQI
ncbi:uncharacterized protein LOC108655377, partial [Drosophila navojoa]|uniref:uncharacterized protein LOC108655377 n=1 Tax=Drosophila navojoa TaxID=7232 RepID=UPI0011BDD22D